MQFAISTKLAFLLAGGYNENGRRLSADLRELIRSRDALKCVQCGEPGDEIDHILGDSNDPSNLQLLCVSCHRTKTAERMKPTSTEQDEWIDEFFETQIVPHQPKHLVDDEIRWNSVRRPLGAARTARRRERAQSRPESAPTGA
ncbi:HNH endonuclease signature motif containing protein [Nakamurella sp. A5-74]|uniref:HNH endonuclease signature motif containing protein n=1 Tax=Nakamurella sp. A5-74 TaxID=3158264 RepID=A0AAU8DQP4_9ACTN